MNIIDVYVYVYNIYIYVYIYIMRPTLGIYFEVEPGSGIFFFNNFHFLIISM